MGLRVGKANCYNITESLISTSNGKEGEMDDDGDFVSWLGCRMLYVFTAKLERLRCVDGLSGCLSDVKKGKWTLFLNKYISPKTSPEIPLWANPVKYSFGQRVYMRNPNITSPWAYVMEGKAFWLLRSAFFLCWLVILWTGQVTLATQPTGLFSHLQNEEAQHATTTYHQLYHCCWSRGD